MKILNSERLILRKFKLTDSKDVYEYAKSDLVGPMAGWKPHKDENESKYIINMFIEGNENYAIVLKSENKVIGGIGLHNRTPDDSLKNIDQREIGYVLNPSYWGQGIMPEAVNTLLEYGFRELDIDLIWCCHFDFNNKSKRVIEKCGFKHVFNQNKEMVNFDNKKALSLCYNISKEEYLNR